MWRSIINGTAINLSGMILSTVINFALVVLVIDYYGFGASGYLVLINLLGVTGLVGLCDFSIPFISNRVFSKYQGKSPKFLKVVFSFYSLMLFCVSIVCLLACCTVVLAIQPQYSSIFLVVGFAYPIVFQGLISKAYFLSRKNFLLIQISKLFTDFGRLGGFLFAKHYADIETYFYIYIFAALIPSIYLSLLSMYQIGVTRINRTLVRKLFIITLGEAKFHFAGRIGSVVSVNAERLVFSTQDVSILGVVDALMKLPNLITGLSGVAVSTVVPFVANKQANDLKRDTLQFYVYGQTIYISIVVFLATFFLFNSRFFLEFFFNLGSGLEVQIFGFLLVACVINCLTFGANFLLALKVKLEEVTRYRISSAFFKVLMNALLLGFGFGISAIGYTWLASSFLVVMLLVAIKQTFKINMLKFMMLLILIASISFLSCFLMATYMGPVTTLSELIYMLIACSISYLVVMGFSVAALKKTIFTVEDAFL